MKRRNLIEFQNKFLDALLVLALLLIISGGVLYVCLHGDEIEKTTIVIKNSLQPPLENMFVQYGLFLLIFAQFARLLLVTGVFYMKRNMSSVWMSLYVFLFLIISFFLYS